MFTGIIETLGEVKLIQREQSNMHFTIISPISSALKIDQSVAHNGVCLTVVACDAQSHTVTAIDETLKKSNLRHLKVGDEVNLERCLRLGDRLDGHMVQGHVDTTAICLTCTEQDGSWLYDFGLSEDQGGLMVDKGSITLNGVSLTIVKCSDNAFQVAIIPFTKTHTTFKGMIPGDVVNVEYDILGKYVLQQNRMPKGF